MHLVVAMRTVFTLAFVFATFTSVAMGEGIADGSALSNQQSQQLLASSRRVDETKKQLDSAEEALKTAKESKDTSPLKLAQLEVDRDKAKEQHDQALAQFQSDINQAHQNNARSDQLTKNQGGSNGHQEKGGGSGKGGGMPPLPQPPSPPKKDSKEDSPKEEPTKPPAAQAPTPQPAAEKPVAQLTDADILPALKEQLANPSEIDSQGNVREQNETPPGPLTKGAQELTDAIVSQSEQTAAQIIKAEGAALLPKTTGSVLAAASGTSAKPSQNQTRATGLAGALSAQVSQSPSASSSEGKIASTTVQATSTQRALRGVSNEPTANPSEEEPASAPAFDMASLLGGAMDSNSSPDYGPGLLRSERLTRSVAQDRLVNPNAPILPSALRAIMESNKLVVGTPAGK